MLPLIPLLSIAGSVGGSIFANAQSKKINDQMTGLIDQREGDIQSYFGKQLNTPYLQTAEAQAAIQKMNLQNDRMLEARQNNAISGGATAEAQNALKGKLQENTSGLLGQLAGYGTQRADQMGAQYQDAMQNIYNMRAGQNQQQQASVQNFGQNVGSAMGGVMDAWGQGAFKEWGNLWKKKE